MKYIYFETKTNYLKNYSALENIEHIKCNINDQIKNCERKELRFTQNIWNNNKNLQNMWHGKPFLEENLKNSLLLNSLYV